MDAKQRRNAGRSIMVLLLVSFFLAAGAMPAVAGASAKGAVWQKGAKERPRHHRPLLGIWQNPEMVQKLELAAEQVKKLREADFASREKRLELKAQLYRLELQMEKAFSDDTADKKTILGLAEKITEVRGSLFIQEIESRLAMGKILNADQMDKLKMHLWKEKKCAPKSGRRGRVSNHASGNVVFAQDRGGRRQGPPPEAYTACEGKTAGDTAEFESPRGDTATGTCVQRGDRLVLHPDSPPERGGRRGRTTSSG